MRDIERRLASRRSRPILQGPRWNFSSLSDEDLTFLESMQNVKCMSEVPAADIERLERMLLSAGRVEGAT